MKDSEKLHITVLGCGTSTGVPVPACRCPVCLSKHPRNQRTRTSILVTLPGGENILVDTSPDLRFQVLRHKVDHIDAVLFTHAHADHIMGLDDLRAYNFAQKAEIPCYATNETFSKIKKIFWYVFDHDLNIEGGTPPRLKVMPFDYYRPIKLFGFDVTPFKLLHGSMEVAGFRFGEFSYATDCKIIPKQSMDYVDNAKLLILTGLREAPHNTHLTIPEAVELAGKLNTDQTYLIHMSHDVDYEKTSKQLPDNIRLCYDGLSLKI
ncbi:MAG: MBL fold metallo-hydrolase [Candidatus Dadabacteria bacterium]|nr:MAG: MBL fold metallo-hydrolase [Candidatus Dadabacteria bacterium]